MTRRPLTSEYDASGRMIEQDPDALPRFDDQVIRSRAPLAQVDLVWGSSAVKAVVWAARDTGIELAIPLGQPRPGIGDSAIVAGDVPMRPVRMRVVVERIREAFGSFAVLECRAAARAAPGSTQRRANARFRFSPLFPLFCFARHPVLRELIAFRAVDVSNGGISLECAPPDAALFPGLQLRCQFDAPSIGRFVTDVVIRDAGSAQTKANGRAREQLRVRAEFAGLAPEAREIIASCIVRAKSSNGLSDLRRENYLVRDWPRLVEFVSAADHASASTTGEIAIIARLGDETVGRVTVAVAGNDAPAISECAVNHALDRRAVVELLRAEMTTRLAERGFDKRFVQTCMQRLAHAPLHGFESPRIPRDDAGNAHAPPHTGLGAGRHATHPGEHVHDVRWDEYAEAYDVMCATNPAYQQNIALFRDWLDGLALPHNARIADVGAGTGNYVIELARRFPDAQLIHVDRDPVMNRSAARKYQAYGIDNVSFVAANALEVGFEPASLDAIVCVNALYAFDDIDIVLREYRSWLKPDGQLFLIDLGREMRVGDWFRYIVGTSVRAFGLRTTLSYLLRGRKAVPQNRLISREQHSGRYWLHTPEQFRVALEDAGFEIVRAQTCYRDACDLAVCRRGAVPHAAGRAAVSPAE